MNDIDGKPVVVPKGSVNPCQTVEECLAWAESGEMCCGNRTELSIKTLAEEVHRLQDRLRAIYRFGRANSGCGWTCATMAMNALRQLPNAERSGSES